MTKQPELSDKELLELGKKLQQFYETGYVNKKQALIFTFYKGMAGGFGAFLGGTILIALLLWVLNLFGHVPFIDQIAQQISNSLHK